MKSYRIYCFDRGSRIVMAEVVEAVNDAEALVAAKQVMDCVRTEVWDRDRLVGRIEPRAN